MLIPDSFAVALSAITAYNFRFPDASTLMDGEPAIAQFEYRGILSVVVIAWILLLVATSTYRFSHATLVVFNLRMIIKRSFTFFLLLGFLSFILKASFSRSVFLVMLGSGLLYLFLVRITVHGLVLRPLILKKKFRQI
jgi:FlaA1/EpsC-like NDP-sugar epimerase